MLLKIFHVPFSTSSVGQILIFLKFTQDKKKLHAAIVKDETNDPKKQISVVFFYILLRDLDFGIIVANATKI
jgi:hypothetical protein